MGACALLGRLTVVLLRKRDSLGSSRRGKEGDGIADCSLLHTFLLVQGARSLPGYRVNVCVHNTAVCVCVRSQRRNKRFSLLSSSDLFRQSRRRLYKRLLEHRAGEVSYM